MHWSSRDRVSSPTQGWQARGRRNLVFVLTSILLSGAAWIGLLSCLLMVESDAASAALAWPAVPLTSKSAAATGQPGLRRVTFDGRSIPWTWTPDGQSLLIKRPGRVTVGQQLFELWLVSLQDGAGRRLAENAIQPAAEGSRVAYLRYVERGQWEVVVAALADGQPLHVGAAQYKVAPAWTRGEVVYLRPTQEWGVRAGSDRPPSLAALPAAYTRARLAHDGQIVAATDGRRLWALGLMEPIVVAQADQIGGFSWSPVAARLAYVREPGARLAPGGGPMPELWVWEAETGRSWMLARGELEHFGEPSWAPDGRTLAFVRQPTGNGGNATGDIWLVQADGASVARPLARTLADEGSPRWSPDGQYLAFSMDGDTWIADPDAPGLQAELAAPQGAASDTTARLEEPVRTAPVAPFGLPAPLTIWVLHDGAQNTCRDVPDGQIDVLSFEQYVKQVVPNEVPALWPVEVVKAQAVAARTYGWRKTLDRPYPAYPYTVKDSTADQYMCDRTHERSDVAVDATAGQHVEYGGKVIYSFYCAEAGDPTNYRMLHSATPYLRPVSDPVGFGRTRNGHSWGMSQWGAYRWAVQHGWNYQQILGHYYTSAVVEPSISGAQPPAALILPWPDHYVTGDRAFLQANAGGLASTASNASILTVTFAARLAETWTTIYTDTESSDGWDHVWSVDSLSDTITPSIALKVTAYGPAGQASESGVTWIGLNRALLTGTLEASPALASTDVTTLSVPLALTVADPSPDRGPIRVSLGSGDWVWEDGALAWTAGERVTDVAAGDGSAWYIAAGTAGTLSGVGIENLAPGQSYRATFRLKAPAEALTRTAELARLAVLADAAGGAELLGVRYVRGTDIKAADDYQEFVVDFAEAPNSGELQWQVDSFGASDLWVDRIGASDYPVQVTPMVTWTLPAREGSATITARFWDGAENASSAVSLAVTVTDRSPPGQWRRLECSAATCVVQVRDAIAGLDTDRASVRLSGDGGQSWSDWQPAACTGEDGSHDWETLTVVVATAPTTGGMQQIQFRAIDRAAIPNEGLSPIYVRSWAYLPIVTGTTR